MHCALILVPHLPLSLSRSYLASSSLVCPRAAYPSNTSAPQVTSDPQRSIAIACHLPLSPSALLASRLQATITCPLVSTTSCDDPLSAAPPQCSPLFGTFSLSVSFPRIVRYRTVTKGEDIALLFPLDLAQWLRISVTTGGELSSAISVSRFRRPLSSTCWFAAVSVGVKRVRRKADCLAPRDVST